MVVWYRADSWQTGEEVHVGARNKLELSLDKYKYHLEFGLAQNIKGSIYHHIPRSKLVFGQM